MEEYNNDLTRSLGENEVGKTDLQDLHAKVQLEKTVAHQDLHEKLDPKQQNYEREPVRRTRPTCWKNFICSSIPGSTCLSLIAHILSFENHMIFQPVRKLYDSYVIHQNKTIDYLIGPAQQYACNAFTYDTFGDHFQTCQTKSAASQVHDRGVYKLGAILGSVGHRIKIHKITPVTDIERGDIEIKYYVVLQKPEAQDNRLPGSPRTLIMDFTMTHVRFGRSHLHPMGQLTYTRRSEMVLMTQIGL